MIRMINKKGEWSDETHSCQNNLNLNIKSNSSHYNVINYAVAKKCEAEFL